MRLYKYQPLYKYDGPTHTQPFREELSLDEQKNNLELFFSEIADHFEAEAKLERKNDGFIWITSGLTQADCDAKVKRCLNKLDLYAKRIPAK